MLQSYEKSSEMAKFLFCHFRDQSNLGAANVSEKFSVFCYQFSVF